MEKTYEVTENEEDEDDFVVETTTMEKTRIYRKQELIDEIARLQAILNNFEN